MQTYTFPLSSVVARTSDNQQSKAMHKQFKTMADKQQKIVYISLSQLLDFDKIY